MSSVSVCMAVCNGELFIRQQLDSILLQLQKADELIISDDASTDRTLAIIQSYGDSRIRILPPKKFGNPSSNFEYALMHCRHDIIFLADQDDYWYPSKIERMKDILSGADLVVCDSRILHPNKTIDVSFFASNRSKPGLWRNLIKSSYMGCCMAFHKKVIEKSLPFPKNGVMYDQWIGLIAERFFKVAFMEEVLVDHRIHHTNYTTTGTKSRNSIQKRIKMRFLLTKSLLAR